MTMYLLREPGALAEKPANCAATVSVWYLPGGYDAVRARAVFIYFEHAEHAEKFVRKYQDAPEMAVLVGVTQMDV